MNKSEKNQDFINAAKYLSTELKKDINIFTSPTNATKRNLKTKEKNESRD